MSKVIFGFLSVFFITATASAGSKAYMHVEFYRDIYKPVLTKSSDVVVGVLSDGTSLQLANSSDEIKDKTLNGRYDFYLEKNDGALARVKFSLIDYSGMTMGGGGYSRQYSFQSAMLAGDTNEITFTLGDLSDPMKPDAGMDYLMKVRLDRVVPCDDKTTCFND